MLRTLNKTMRTAATFVGSSSGKNPRMYKPNTLVIAAVGAANPTRSETHADTKPSAG